MVIVLSPFEVPDAAIVLAALHAGALGVLDLGRDRAAAQAALTRVAHAPSRSIGLRIPRGAECDPARLPESIGTIVLDDARDVQRWREFDVLVQVTSLPEARAAEQSGASGLIAKGCEAGGRVGDESSLVLLQSLLREIALPIHVQGGIGLQTAVACVVAGAAGVVLDSQLSLCRESQIPAALKIAIAAMDGSETTVLRGHRVYRRADVPLDAWNDVDDVASAFGTDLHARLLAAGQDACFARPLAERFRTVGRVVRAFLATLDSGVDLAAEQHALARNAPLARALHLDYPIFQGPMTRVSDATPFAAAVAQAGAMPFLALALMRGAEVEALLEETARTLQDRPWGVGILGFVPAELRDEQIAAIARVKPPVALIAGGRPAQARPLDEIGIATFLHVPSPGLLDLFLKQGARRFVFEGSECGGHVGPRTSFVLWQQQIERLLRHPSPSELEVVFAGGIHDARSAAMVAAMAAPLVARGAHIGILMGTAYLFTREAVACGAVQAAFQQAALQCEQTVLLETAPGHATRCACTPYVDSFRAQRAALERDGVPQKQMWEILERLNLGRLRIAAKGLARDGDRIASVDEATQRREGMVMLGQVAALRDRVGAVAELHRDVSEGACAWLERVAAQRRTDAMPNRDDVAIIGMAAIMPGAADLDAFWANIVNGVNSIREVPPERWRVETFYDPQSMDGDKTPSKWGGFLDAVAFDPLAYGIPPRSLAAIEPVQLLALEASRRALRDAGYLDRDFDRENTSVVFGAEGGTDLAGAYGFRALWRQYAGPMPPELDGVLPTLTEDSFAGILGNVIAGRIANRLDFGGANYTVDAACASSLAAIDLACRELTSGRSNMVVCGGADLHNNITDFLVFASVHALSPTGQCRPFDAGADGIALGEGVAAIVLKRLADAERDGDRIYAVIKSVGAASDGKSLGLTAPRTEGQLRALQRAYRYAATAPGEVGLVEAHGTGTVVGDRTELETLNRFFGSAGAPPASIALGSVKSQIGHTKCAAGIAGLVKTALALHHRVLPPTLNIRQPNPGWTPESSFTLDSMPRPWPGRDRKAGISAFGFGGTNFHAVLAEHAPSQAASGHAQWPGELFLLRGSSLDGAIARAGQLLALAERHSHRLRDLACSTSSGTQPVRIALVARDVSDLTLKLGAVRERRNDVAGVFYATDDPMLGTIAFLFPGQGSQRVGMLRDLFIAFPALQEYLAPESRLARHMFPVTPWNDEDKRAQREAINDTRIAQPALGIAGLAVSRLLETFGVHAAMYGGHSYGELVALCAAGAMSPAQLIELSERRGERIVDAASRAGDVGTMAAVGASAAAAAACLEGVEGIVIANDNGPDQCVISGTGAGIAEATQRLKAAGLSARPLEVSCAFHSPLVRDACASFASDLARIRIDPPILPVYSNTIAAPHSGDADAIRALLARHIGETVRFGAQIEAMYADGARIFVEAGPGRVLTGLVSRILRGRPHVAIACDRAGEPGVVQLLLALAQLAVQGVELDTERLFGDRDAERFDLEHAPENALPPSAWWVNGQRAWPIRGEPPEYAMRPILQPVLRAPPATEGAAPVTDDRQQAILEYMRNMRELVEAQRKVMLGFLGASDADAALNLTPRATDVIVQASRPPPPRPALLPAVEAQSQVEVVAASIATSSDQPADIRATLLAVVCERTGYPAEMLSLDLDLEADLSIDSIKRVEILGAVAERLGSRVTGGIQELPEDLVSVKTLRGIIEALEARLRSSAAPAADDAPANDAPDEAESTHPAIGASAPPLSRYVVELTDAPRVASESLSPDATVGIVGGPAGTVTELEQRISAAGRKVTALRNGGSAEPNVGALVDLTPLGEWNVDAVAGLFTRVRHALLSGTSHVLVAGASATGEGADLPRINGHLVPAAAGVSGMIKSLHREWPDRVIRMASFPRGVASDQVVAHLLAELATGDSGEIGYSQEGVRQRPGVVAADLEPATARIALTRDSVVLVTGGARGITARAAIELARRFGCRLELIGRTPLTADDAHADLADALDARTLRQRLVARDGTESPASIEAKVRRILAEREIRATLEKVEAAGGSANYTAIDVRDAPVFGAAIDAIYARHGRLDGVIHGAGVIEDKLARDKSAESFARVFETKVNGALTIAEKVRDDIGFIVFFSSIAATFGSRGQSDYAAANDFLDRLAVKLNPKLQGRVVSINWGPWRDGGMVSPELEREYARRGIGLIEPEAGVAGFIDELLHGPANDAHVILMRGDPAALA